MRLKGPMVIVHKLDSRVDGLPSARTGLSGHQVSAQENEKTSCCLRLLNFKTHLRFRPMFMGAGMDRVLSAKKRNLFPRLKKFRC